MRNLISLSALTALIAIGVAGVASAQLSLPAPPPECNCNVTVDGPKAGVHSGDLADGEDIHVVLWPPNHKLHEVTISADDPSTSEADDCDVEIDTVMQDEAVDAPGSGNTVGADAENCSNDGNTSTVDLRAERSGLGDGRYYDIEYNTTDSMGMTCDDQHVIALVPHDQRVNQNWPNDGAPLPSGVVCMPGMP